MFTHVPLHETYLTLSSSVAANIPMYIQRIDRMTQASEKAANLLTNRTPINTMTDRIKRMTVP